MNTEFLLLQINDALFPIGGFSHSYGLETYIQKNIIRNEDDVKSYIYRKIKYSTSNTELLGARLAYERAENINEIKKLDDILTAAKSPKEIRQASLKLGSRFIKTLKGCEIKLKYNYFDEYTSLDYFNKHHSTAYGVICKSAGADLKTALNTYIYAQCSAMITNCVKTVPISQSVGQKILYSSYDFLNDTVNSVLEMDEDDFCSSAPAFDIRCMEHERLYSRIYMS